MQWQPIIIDAFHRSPKSNDQSWFSAIPRLRVEDKKGMLVAEQFVADFLNSAHNRIVKAGREDSGAFHESRYPDCCEDQ